MHFSNTLLKVKRLIVLYGFMAGAFGATLDVRLQGIIDSPSGDLGPTFLITFQIDQFPSPVTSRNDEYFTTDVLATLVSGSKKWTVPAIAGYYGDDFPFPGISILIIVESGLALEFLLDIPSFIDSGFIPPPSGPEVLALKKTGLSGSVFSLRPTLSKLSPLSNGLY